MHVPRKQFLGNYWSHHHQAWHGNCHRDANDSRVNYIDLDIHSSSHRSYLRKNYDKCLIITETLRFKESPSRFLCRYSDWRFICPLNVRWPLPSLKITNASQTWLCFNLPYVGTYLSYYSQTWHDGRPIHGIICIVICACTFQWPWPWCKVIVCRQSQKFIVELIQQVKHATSIKLATTEAF